MRVPAEPVLDVIDPPYFGIAGQLRGFSHYAPVLAKLFILDQYDDAELDRKKVAAMFAGFVRRPVNDDMDRQETDSEGLLPLEPGQLQFLEDGEDITFAEPSDVGGNYEAFQYRTLLQVAAGLGLPYANLTADMVKLARCESLQIIPTLVRHCWNFGRGLRLSAACGSLPALGHGLPDVQARVVALDGVELGVPTWTRRCSPER